METRLSVFVLVVVSMVGCLSGNAPSEEDSATEETRLHPMDTSADLEDCVEVAAGFQVDVERVQHHLPQGFTAAEGRPFGGDLPDLPTGMVVVTVGAISCEYADLEDGPLAQLNVAVDVEAPRTAAVEERTTHQVYRLLTYTQGDRHARFLESANASVIPADVTVDVQALPASSTGTATVSDREGAVFELDVAGGGRASFGVSARFWEILPEGLLVLDWQQDKEPLVAYDLGPVHSCSVREKTLLHELLGSTDCTDQLTTGLVVPSWHTEGRIRVIPDAGVKVAE